MLGLTDKMEPWSGGDVPLALRQSPPLPSGEEVAAARVPAQAFVGGGAWGLTRAARLAGMGWTIDPTADVALLPRWNALMRPMCGKDARRSRGRGMAEMSGLRTRLRAPGGLGPSMWPWS